MNNFMQYFEQDSEGHLNSLVIVEKNLFLAT
jgi:hypothetical protein